MKNSFKKVMCVGLLIVFGFIGCHQHTGRPDNPIKVESPSFEKRVEDINRHYCEVLTHQMSVCKRRGYEVSPALVKRATRQITTILNKQLWNFRVTSCEVNDTYGKIWYDATFFVADGKVRKHSDIIYFQLLGEAGDPI